jgi:hypothetical protein
VRVSLFVIVVVIVVAGTGSLTKFMFAFFIYPSSDSPSVDLTMSTHIQNTVTRASRIIGWVIKTFRGRF